MIVVSIPWGWLGEAGMARGTDNGWASAAIDQLGANLGVVETKALPIRGRTIRNEAAVCLLGS